MSLNLIGKYSNVDTLEKLYNNLLYDSFKYLTIEQRLMYQKEFDRIKFTEILKQQELQKKEQELKEKENKVTKNYLDTKAKEEADKAVKKGIEKLKKDIFDKD